MALADWTQTSGTWALDASVKYAGNSSVRIADDGLLARGSLSQFQAIYWVRRTYVSSICGVYHISYGNIQAQAYLTTDTWEKIRITAWYDAGNNTKWSRVEKLVDGVWVAQAADTNRGAGAPATSTFNIQSTSYAGLSNWFDEVEVYAVS